MKVKSILIAALLVIAFACDDGDEVSNKKTSLLTLTVDASYNRDLYDDWILVHAEDGSLLAFKSFETNQELNIVTDKTVPGKITVTHLSYSTEDGYKFYYATSHSNIEKGKHMVVKGKNGPNPQSTGHVNWTQRV